MKIVFKCEDLFIEPLNQRRATVCEWNDCPMWAGLAKIDDCRLCPFHQENLPDKYKHAITIAQALEHAEMLADLEVSDED